MKQLIFIIDRIIPSKSIEKLISTRLHFSFFFVALEYILLQDYDGLMTEWQSAGRRLALEMSELKECTTLSGTLTPLGRLLTDPSLRRTSRDAEEAIASLEERAAPLIHLDYIRLERVIRLKIVFKLIKRSLHLKIIDQRRETWDTFNGMVINLFVNI